MPMFTTHSEGQTGAHLDTIERAVSGMRVRLILAWCCQNEDSRPGARELLALMACGTVLRSGLMFVYDGALELACAPERWFVELTTGDTLEVLTHGYSIQGGRYVFSLLFRGEPHFEITVLSLPHRSCAA
jgi:hypothetical protein